ncbi:MAG: GAF domain-containing protein, partial [Planctomycetota bacterium]|nr:GAF domain-containing protein [Planctomycetota bacterium]
MAHTLEQTVQNVGKIINARWATVFVLDQATQTLHTRATSLPHPGAKTASVPLAVPTLMAACLREGRALVVPDTSKDARCNPEYIRRFDVASVVCVPLGPPAQRFGVLLMTNPTPVEFSADEVRRVEQVAQLASAAIERARIYEEACQRADDLILLNEVGHLLAESPALESTLQRIAELVCRSFQLTGAGFLLLAENSDALVARGVFGVHSPKLTALRLPLDTADVTAQAFRQHQTLVVEDGATDKRVHRLLRKMLPGAVSGAAIPMAGPRGPVGILGVWKDQPSAFTPRDLQCLAGVARLAAAAVGRGELVQALQASEKRLQEVVDGIHAMIISIDPQGNVQTVNATAERMIGVKAEAILGRPLAQTSNLSQSEQARLRTTITRAFATLDCGEQLVLNWTTPEGHERKIRWRSSFMRNPDGKVTGMVCLGVDITEQVLLEAQLLQAQKMESVGALAGGMAHDFNNLLGGIIGQCTLLRAHTADQRTLAALPHIESAAKRGADLTAQLMAFARKSVLQPRSVDIGALIKESAALLAGSLPHAVRIVTDIAPGLPRVHGDPTQLQQVLLNLCVNARDAMPDGGTLTIDARLAAVTASDAQSPPGVLLEVIDTGTGMTEEVQQHLFEPFFTTKKPGKGTGLGLSVVFGIVRSHGGQITCHSQANKGTRFSIRLPGAKRPSSGERPSSGAATGSNAGLGAVGAASQLSSAQPYAGRENLLLVDDDAILRETVCQLLQTLGYNVRAATNGADALRILDTERGFVPAVVLLDVVMPGLAGTPLYTELGRRAPATPVILMSGYSADQTVADLLNAGARELVQKPFTVDVLASAIRLALQPAAT